MCAYLQVAGVSLEVLFSVPDLDYEVPLQLLHFLGRDATVVALAVLPHCCISAFSSVKMYNMHSCSHCCNPASIIVTGNETGLLFLPALLPCEQVPSLGSPESADSTTNVTVEVGSFQTSTINGLGNQLEESLACIFFSFYYFTRIKKYTIESFQCPRFLSLLP